MPARSSAKERVEPEYRLLIAPHLAERTLRYVTRVILETTKTFATFPYELSVREEIDDDSITLAVLGFKTPHLTMPAPGPARFRKEYENLRGTYTVLIAGIDGRENSFSIRISPKKVELLKSPRKPFVQIVTDASRWMSPTT
jgi:hypothetical protein